jgi:hypothetical protein
VAVAVELVVAWEAYRQAPPEVEPHKKPVAVVAFALVVEDIAVVVVACAVASCHHHHEEEEVGLQVVAAVHHEIQVAVHVVDFQNQAAVDLVQAVEG